MFVKKLIKTAFQYSNRDSDSDSNRNSNTIYKAIERVYLKSKITEEELDLRIEELLTIKPAKKSTYIDLQDESEEEEEAEEDNLDGNTEDGVTIEEMVPKKNIKRHRN